MNWTGYLFAFYVFVLASILVFIWTKASRGKLDERINLLEDKQRELIVLQNDTKDAIMVFETHIYEAKEDLEKEREKIQFLIDQFEDMLDKNNTIMQPVTQKNPGAVVDISKDYIGRESEEETDKGNLYEQISKLTKKGYSIDDIVKKLGISKGEANFILGISK